MRNRLNDKGRMIGGDRQEGMGGRNRRDGQVKFAGGKEEGKKRKRK